jgi:hypothetical protein
MFERLQPHVLTRCEGLLSDDYSQPSALFTQLVGIVDDAIAKKRLNSPGPAGTLVRRYVDLPAKLPRDLSMDRGWQYEAIHGGEKVFRQERGSLDIGRDDGAWFHFTIALRSRRQPQAFELLGYNFEIVFPDRTKGPRFLRWDFNPPGHTNDERSLRAHMHPSIDEEAELAQVPTPVMHPVELLSLFIHRLRW